MVERIRELLDARQLSPTQFADTIGIGRPVVSHILSGRNKASLEVVQKIIAAFPELALPWLLNGEGPMLAAAAPAPTAGTREPKLTEAQTPPVATRTRRAPPTSPKTASAAAESAKTSAAEQAVPAAPSPLAEAAPTTGQPTTPEAAAVPVSPVAPAAGSGPGPLPNPGKAIRRIVIFYHDGTFVDYQPEN